MAWLLVGAAALYVGFWLSVRLRSLLMMLVISLFLAFALEPAANVLARRGWRRGLATATVFVLLAAGVVAFVGGLGALLALPAAGPGLDLPAPLRGHGQPLTAPQPEAPAPPRA